eukprot:1194986-Prorocentrum_minimum.AAC.3
MIRLWSRGSVLRSPRLARGTSQDTRLKCSTGFTVRIANRPGPSAARGGHSASPPVRACNHHLEHTPKFVSGRV